jgi:glycosyltransferase involved in cell wall biosynthesis
LPTGIDRVCLAYAAHYRERARAVIQHDRFREILPERASRALFDLLLGSDGFRMGAVRLVLRSLPSLITREFGENLTYLNVGHTGLDQPGLRDWIVRTRVRPVYMVHDLIPLTHSIHCRAGEDVRHAARMRTVLQTGRGIIVNSRDTLGALTDWAAHQALAMPPAQVAWLGTTPLRIADTASPLAGPYFVTVGTIEARKNHVLLLRVWRMLIERLGAAAPKLVVIGQRGWEAAEAHAMLDEPVLRGHVVELAHCGDATLARYLAHARALLFPAFVEGYGLPLIEALAARVPVIASDLTVFRELASDVPLYLNSRDTLAWCAAIDEYTGNGADRTRQISAMASYKAPTWADHFTAVDNWLETLD